MKKDFYAVYANITCPHCQVKQTGIERLYDIATGKHVEFTPDPQILRYHSDYPDNEFVFAIKCTWSKCGKLITGDDLEKVTRTKVKSPSDFRG